MPGYRGCPGHSTRAVPTGVGTALVQEGWLSAAAPPGPVMLRRSPLNSAKTPWWWSCGESNPGPRAPIQVFSGCSQCCRFSRPRRSHRHVADRPSQEKVPITPPDRKRSASPLDEAWIRDGDGCPVRPFDHCSGSESEVVAIRVGNCVFQRSFTRWRWLLDPLLLELTSQVETDQPLLSCVVQSTVPNRQSTTGIPPRACHGNPCVSIRTDVRSNQCTGLPVPDGLTTVSWHG